MSRSVRRLLLPVLLLAALVAAAPAPVAAAAPIGSLSIPAASLRVSVYDFGCRGGTLPMRVERWGCAGTGNTYLLGHNAGPFTPLARAYAAHRLRVGSLATLTVRGVTRRYRLVFARVVPATFRWHGLDGSAWAWNATARPSVTLQTCYGPGLRSRLVVRFAAP